MSIYRGEGGAGESLSDVTLNLIAAYTETATNKAAEASASALAADASADAAAVSEASANADALSAAASAAAALVSENNAGVSETNAAASEAAAAALVANAVTKTSDTGSVQITSGTTAQRDGTPAAGYFRFNSTNTQFEGYNGSAWTGVGGASGGGGNPFVYENDITVTTNYTITTNKNAMSAGPISINSGVTVTVPTGSVWSII